MYRYSKIRRALLLVLLEFLSISNKNNLGPNLKRFQYEIENINMEYEKMRKIRQIHFMNKIAF